MDKRHHEKIKALWLQGLNRKEISKVMGLSESTIRYVTDEGYAEIIKKRAREYGRTHAEEKKKRYRTDIVYRKKCNKYQVKYRAQRQQGL